MLEVREVLWRWLAGKGSILVERLWAGKWTARRSAATWQPGRSSVWSVTATAVQLSDVAAAETVTANTERQ